MYRIEYCREKETAKNCEKKICLKTLYAYAAA